LAVALVIVLALAFEPFVQQSLKFPPRDILVEGLQPTLATSTNLSYNIDYADDNSIQLSALFMQALYADSVAAIQPFCPTSRCEWPSYMTVAVCSSCKDVTNQTRISSNDESSLRALATGGFLHDFRGMGNLSSGAYGMYDFSTTTNYTVSLHSGPSTSFAANFSGSLSTEGTLLNYLYFPSEIIFDASDRPEITVSHGFPNFPNITDRPFTTLAYVRLNRSSDRLRLEAISSQVCSISLCARQQSSTVVNGSMNSHVDKQTWGRYFGSVDRQMQLPAYFWSAKLNSTEFVTWNASLIDLLDTYLRNMANATIATLSADYALYKHDDPTGGYNSALSIAHPSADTMQYLTDMSNSSARIAQAFTNFIRQSGSTHALGKAYTSRPFVEVQWAWLTFPLVLVFTCIVILGITMFQTRRHDLPIWKASPFPLVFGLQYQKPAVKTLASTPSPPTSQSTTTTTEGLAALSIMLAEPTVKKDRDKTFEGMAKETVVQLAKRDGQWIFESSI
jgi:hypothetical protein